MKLIAFAASSSKKSINKQLIEYAVSLIPQADTEILDLNDYELPIFSVDREEQLGQPMLAKQFYNKIGEADALMISFAEHNGSYSAAYKNLFDWLSRIDRKVFQDKPTVLLATSPGPGGAARVLGHALTSAPHFGANVLADLSISNFHDHFNSDTKKLTSIERRRELEAVVAKLVS